MTTEIIETTVQPAEQVEIKNPAGLVAKNQELLRELGDTKAALQVATDALGLAQSENAALTAKLYQLEVENPLEADLRAASAVPWQYTRDTAIKLGLLEMKPDKQGVMRPKWFDETGEAANLEGGLFNFLSGVYSRTKVDDLGKCLRSSGATGGGATGGGSAAPRPTAPTPTTPTPVQALGLR
jgi:hypothetical protein